MKKLLSIMLSIVLMAGAASVAYAATESTATNKNTQTAVNAAYTDIKTTNWAYEAVNAMSGKGIIKGYQDGSLKPSSTVTYGEFIKMALISDTGEDIGNAPVVDKETGAKQNWAQSYYDKALELKYFGSTDIKAEQLSKPIPRGDMALVMSNILGETKIENYAELQESLTDINASVRNEYDIVKVYAKGIITGYEDGSFKPENTLTRAESATVIYRLVDESKRVMPNEKKGEQPKPEIPVATGTDIVAVIENYKTFGGSMYSGTDSNGKFEEWYEPGAFAEAKSYEYITDMSGFKVTLGENRGTKWIDINGQPPLKLGWGNLYLMKDSKIVQMTGDGIYDGSQRKEHIDITTIEYFVFPNYKSEEVPYVKGIGQISHIIGIMPNPLYVNK